MQRISDDEQRRLCVEIFELTGHKVDVDDPLIAAAFFYSARLRATSEENRQAADAMLSEVEQRFARTADQALGRIEAGFKRTLAAVTSEVRDAALSSQRVAPQIALPSDRHQSTTASRRTSESATKAALLSPPAAAGIALTIAGTAFVVGMLWAPAPAETKTQKVGQATLSIYSSLDESTKQKLNDELKKNERTAPR